MISFNETWSYYKGEFNNFLQSYDIVHYDFVRPLKPSALRNSGGVSVFIKSSLAKLNIFQRIYEHYENCVILYCKLSSLYNCEDIITFFAYVSPVIIIIKMRRMVYLKYTLVWKTLRLIILTHTYFWLVISIVDVKILLIIFHMII